LDDQTVGKLQDEYRLFFDYLRGNYKDAQADLDGLASRADTPDAIFQLLALRAQVMHARNMTQQARSIVDYLLKVQGGQRRRVEETPLGMVFTPADDRGQLWTRYLAQRLVETATVPNSSPADSPGENEDPIDLRIQVPQDIQNGRIMDEGLQFQLPGPRRGGFRPGMPPAPGAARMGGRPLGPGMQRPPRVFPPQPPQPAEPGAPLPRRFGGFGRRG
jgi:hypothetical protein